MPVELACPHGPLHGPVRQSRPSEFGFKSPGVGSEAVTKARNCRAEVRLSSSGWEGNWLAFNVAHDVKLPGSNEPPLPFLMYPQAEDKGGAVDPLDPDAFKDRITAREPTA